MIYRDATTSLKELSLQFKAVAVTGPRQSGKTTLVRAVFYEKSYVSLENFDTRQFAEEDPRGFLASFPKGAILDEIQRVPHLFSYLQQILDETDEKGFFILTGSNNFLLQQSISQSLAGRVAYLFLLPLSLNEISTEGMDSNQFILKGFYPELYNSTVDYRLFYSNYIRTYLERDVRLLKNILDLGVFQKFLKLCAGRIGQLLNMSSLAVEAGVDSKTVASWISVLETSFILFRLQPHHKNFNKRLVKMPKLYFYDPGLASALIGVDQPEQLALHPYRGALFENLVVVEFMKKAFNQNLSPKLFFWRDNTGHEIDLIIEKHSRLIPVEIKSGKTISNEFYRGIHFWKKLTENEEAFVIYDGDQVFSKSDGITLLPLNDIYAIGDSIL